MQVERDKGQRAVEQRPFDEDDRQDGAHPRQARERRHAAEGMRDPAGTGARVARLRIAAQLEEEEQSRRRVQPRQHVKHRLPAVALAEQARGR